MSERSAALTVAPLTASLTPVRIPMLQRACSCGQHTSGGRCGECQKKASGNTLVANAHQSGAVSALALEALKSGGQPLDSRTRSFMESGFGFDFSQVRVHAHSNAAAAAKSVSAHAYTSGQHIVFGAGQYSPQTGTGKKLLAHELTHVVQQRLAATPGLQTAKAISHPTDASEREAVVVADHIVRGQRVDVVNAPSASVQRDLADVAKAVGTGAAIAGGGALVGLGIAALAGAFKSGKSDQDPDCPKTHSIPDDVNQAIGKAWGESHHGEETVAEHGGRMVTDKAGKKVIRTGTGGGGSISLPGEEPGDVTSGTFHTHPYSKSEGSTLGVAFSGGDITNFIAGGQGSVKYIGAGSCNFALNTIDQAKRDACKTKDIDQLWNNGFAKGSGSFQEKVEAGVKTAIAGCGLCFYKACRPDDQSAVPQTAKLA